MPRLIRPRPPLLAPLAATAATAVLLPLLAGCTVPSAGLTGVTVSKEGQPMGVVLVCRDRIDAAVIYTDEPDADPEAEPEYENGWSAAGPVTDFATWPLTATPAGGAGWTPDEPLRPLRPGQVYTLYGATEDNSWSTNHHSFTLADLAKLTPDQVRYTDPESGTARTVTVADFRAHTCAEWSGG